MRRRRVGQLSFADGLASRREHGRRDVLCEISRLVDWDRIERLVDGLNRNDRGEPAYPPLVMVKVLLLQRWYGLSDPGMEEALSDRLSFLRFAGFGLDDRTPDHSTIWRFREQLASRGLDRSIFEEVVGQMARQGVLVRQGTLVDASLVTSAARRPGHDEAKVSPTDPDARFGTNNERRRFEFGYKLHLAADLGSEIIRDLAVTPANVQEVTMAGAIVPDDAGRVYADRGYCSDRLRADLAARDIEEAIMRRAPAGRPLTPEQIERNHAIAGIRRRVEHLFGTMKRSYRLGRMRAFNLPRVRCDLTLFAIAYNLKRWLRLETA